MVSMRVRPSPFRVPLSVRLRHLICCVGLLAMLGACGSPAAPVEQPTTGGAAQHPASTGVASQPTPSVEPAPATPTLPIVSSTTTAVPAATSTVASTPPAQAETSTPTTGPASEQIAYVKDGQIWLLDLATDAVKQLTTEGQNSSPAWSPDGQTLAFVHVYEQNPEIVTMRADGSDVIRVTNDPAADLVPAYARDGSLFFARKAQGDETEIQIIRRAATGAESVVHSQPGGLCSPVHLSVGSATQLALSINCGRGYNVFLVDLAANKTIDMSLDYAPTSCVYQGTWAHKEPRLAVITALDCSPQVNAAITALRVEGASPQMEEIFINREIVALDWAPDDQALVFARRGLEQDLVGLWLLPLDGTRAPRQILKEGEDPAWRPLPSAGGYH